MPKSLINSNPYEYSSGNVNYIEIKEAQKIIDEIRGINSRLAEQLSQTPVSSVYLQQVLKNLTPKTPSDSFSLPHKQLGEYACIRTIEDIVVINFNKRYTNEVSAVFTVYNSNTPKQIDIGMTTLRVLEAVFGTPGRTIPEMEAITFLQGEFLRNIPKIRYKKDMLFFLASLPRENYIVNRIVDKLTELCEAA